MRNAWICLISGVGELWWLFPRILEIGWWKQLCVQHCCRTQNNEQLIAGKIMQCSHQDGTERTKIFFAFQPSQIARNGTSWVLQAAYTQVSEIGVSCLQSLNLEKINLWNMVILYIADEMRWCKIHNKLCILQFHLSLGQLANWMAAEHTFKLHYFHWGLNPKAPLTVPTDSAWFGFELVWFLLTPSSAVKIVQIFL